MIKLTQNGMTFEFDSVDDVLKFSGRSVVIAGRPVKAPQIVHRKIGMKNGWTREEMAIIFSYIRKGVEVSEVKRDPHLRMRHTKGAIEQIFAKVKLPLDRLEKSSLGVEVKELIKQFKSGTSPYAAHTI